SGDECLTRDRTGGCETCFATVRQHSIQALDERIPTVAITSKLGNMGIATTTLEEAVNQARAGAMWPLLFGLACCAIEMMATQASSYDLSRFGMELNRASPRQADLMIIAGRVSRKMAPV